MTVMKLKSLLLIKSIKPFYNLH